MSGPLVREVLELLTETRSVSGTEGPLAEKLAQWARDRGLTTSLTYVSEGRPNTTIEWARGSGRTVLFSAHLDILKPPSEHPWTPSLRGDLFFGEGVNNMKAALAAMIVAAIHVRDSTPASGRVAILAAMGEIDTLGRGTVAALESGLRADVAINGEPTDLRLLLRHAGVARFTVAIHGASAHVTQREQGLNAIPALARALSDLDASILSERGSPLYEDLPILNVGVVRGGESASMLAGNAEAELDLRWSPGMHPGTARQDIEGWVRERVGPDFGVEVTPMMPPAFYSPGPLDTDPESPAVLAVAAAHRRVVGSPPLIGSWVPLVRYGSDAPHLVSAGIPTCIYGPGRAMDINADREHIVFRDVLTAAEVYAAAAAQLLAQ